MRALFLRARRSSLGLQRYSTCRQRHRRTRSPERPRATAAAQAVVQQPEQSLGEAYAALYTEPPRRFSCTACGKCCTGPGEVWASEEECDRLARHLRLSLPRFLARHTKAYRHRPGWHMLRSQPGTDRKCVFLDNDDRCTVHAVRPLQCATYPYWPELVDPLAWELEALRICEGINHATTEVVDPAHAGAQLALSAAHFAVRDAATTTRKRRGEGRTIADEP